MKRTQDGKQKLFALERDEFYWNYHTRLATGARTS